MNRELGRRERANLEDDLRKILGFTVLGEAKWQNVVLAQIHARDWQSQRLPLTTGERGGSSSPRELEERVEDRKVAGQALRDAEALTRLVPAFEAELVLAQYHGAPTQDLARVAEDLAEVVGRCVRVIDHDTLSEPECRSCARQGKVGKQQYPGHKGVGVYEKAVKHRLCRWCYDHWRAEGRFPPVDVVDLYHRVGARAAGLELAKRVQAAERKAS